MDNFYIYAHLRKDTGDIFYIGKGSNKRAWVKSQRNTYWNNIVNKIGYDVVILKDNLSEPTAFDLEKIYIEKHNPPANFTDGGEGISGYRYLGEKLEKHREQVKHHMNRKEVREKISKIKKKQYRDDPKMKERLRAAKLNSIKDDPDQIRRQSESLKKFYKDEKNRNESSRLKGGLEFVAIKNNKICWQGYSQGLCAEKLGLNQQNISKCLKKQRKTHKGYVFKHIGKN